MTKTASLSPPNSLIAVMDHGGGEVPTDMNGQGVAATPSCVVIGTLMAADGETSVTLTDEPLPKNHGLMNVFEGSVATPSLKLSVYSTHRVVIIEAKVPTTQTRIEIWVNEETEPNDIRIVVLDQGSRKKKS